MAFDINKLVLASPHGVPSGPKLWLYYAGADTIATVNTADYFLAASRLLSLYDSILVTSGIGGTPALNLVYVNAVTVDTSIDVTDGLAITATDTD